MNGKHFPCIYMYVSLGTQAFPATYRRVINCAWVNTLKAGKAWANTSREGRRWVARPSDRLTTNMYDLYACITRNLRKYPGKSIRSTYTKRTRSGWFKHSEPTRTTPVQCSRCAPRTYTNHTILTITELARCVGCFAL